MLWRRKKKKTRKVKIKKTRKTAKIRKRTKRKKKRRKKKTKRSRIRRIRMTRRTKKTRIKKTRSRTKRIRKKIMKQKKDKKDDKRSAAVQKKEEKSFDKTMDFECEGEPKTWPWFENKGHWECEVGNKGKVCAYVCNYNVSKQSIVFCDNGEWMDSRFAHDKCL